MHKIRFDGSVYDTFGELPTVGSRAPDFSLVNTDLHDVTLQKFRDRRKVMNIFPSIDTPVCARSVVTFDRLGADLDDVAMLMISYDLPFAHARFSENNGLSHVIGLSAIRHAGFGENYGVQIMEGPLAGMFGRALVVLDENDNVVHSEQIQNIDDEPNYVAALKSLGVDIDPEQLAG